MIQKEKRGLFLQLLLESYAPAAAQGLWKKLPLQDLELSNSKPECSLVNPIVANIEFLKSAHYTWIAHYISQLPENLQMSAANAFPEFVKIMRVLDGPSVEKVKEQGDVDPYFHHLLIKKMDLENRLPICFLPKSPFGEMLNWDKNKILSLIDLLPLADAGKEIKQIVDKNKLMLIYSAFTEDQKNYLKQCMMTKHVSCEITLNLKGWQGTKERLKIHLHSLGLGLLAKGLAKENPDFIFYLSQRLDIGRGKPLINALANKKEESQDIYFKNLIQAYKFISNI